MPLSTADVIKALLDNGFHWETLPGCEAPVLSNRPSGKHWCIQCGEYMPTEWMKIDQGSLVCKLCKRIATRLRRAQDKK